MRHAGSVHDSFKPVRLAVAAKLVTSELADRSVHFRAWRPLPDIP
jgi:hypothetical protein